ncbi:hydroxylamine reductase [Candidatus Bathyarchaeota archaeon]|nr:hydroxylamine reductase [Candidatus Bathyarchaeota archaeon]
MSMFCFQCQETAKNKGCTIRGVCGKVPDVANLQYALIDLVKGISFWTTKGRTLGLHSGEKGTEIDHYITKMLFSTITNANFDPAWFLARLKVGFKHRDAARDAFLAAYKDKEGKEFDGKVPGAAIWVEEPNEGNLAAITAHGKATDPTNTENEDLRALRELLTYGLKGIAAYADHAFVAGQEDPSIWEFMQEALAALLDESLGADALLELIDRCGAVGVTTMALLDKANTTAFGIPEPTAVDIGVKPGPGILVSGHDLVDLKELLEQTEGKGVNVYTHGEMLPANAYPELKKFPHLVGNYGGSWWHQAKEFDTFNGPILLTTNCLIPPKESYFDRLFVTGNVGWPGVKYIPDREPGKQKDFSEIIELALKTDTPQELETGTVMTGFAHDAVLGVADKVVEAVKAGAIKRLVVMAGCDGRHKTREYFTGVAKALPHEAVILTAGCAKYRYNKLDLGDIGGIPRVLDAGQCNDCYSLAVVALKLAEVFGVDHVNDLPLSFDIGWYEQKAVLVLLVLLHLGIKNIRLGPTLPGFLSANVASIIIEKWGLKSTTTPEADVPAIMEGK